MKTARVASLQARSSDASVNQKKTGMLQNTNYIIHDRRIIL